MGNPLAVRKQRHELSQNPTMAIHDSLVRSHTGGEKEYVEVLKSFGIERTFDKRIERVITARQMFDAFRYSSLDSVGFPSVVWCAHGFMVGATADIDVGSFFMPGFGSMRVSVGASRERLKELFLCVMRVPSQTLLDDGVGITSRPVMLLALRGTSTVYRISGGVSVGVKAGFTVDANKGFAHNCKSYEQIQEEKAKRKLEDKQKTFWELRGDQGLELLSIGAEASATASAGASYEYDVVQLRDTRPSFYASEGDRELEQAVSVFFGPGSKEGVKARAAAFFTDQGVFSSLLRTQPWYVRGAKLVTGGRIPFANLKQSLDDADTYLRWLGQMATAENKAKVRNVEMLRLEVESHLTKDKGTRHGDQGKQITKSKLDGLFGHELLRPWKPERHFFGGNASLGEYLEALKQARSVVDLLEKPELREAALAEVRHHQQVIDTFQTYVSSDDGTRTSLMQGSDDGAQPDLCFLDISGHKPTVEAGIGAKVEARGLGTLLTTGAGVDAKASKQWKYTHYRFQHACELDHCMETGGVSGKVPLITTQDTSLRYSQTVFSAEAKLQAVGSTVTNAERTKVFNTLSYESATVRWSLPTAMPGQRLPDEAPVQCLVGTGYAFGQSVTVPSLLEARDAYRTGDDLQLVQVIADRLDVPLDRLLEVLERAPVFQGRGLEELIDNKVNTVLLESSFYAPLQTAVKVDLRDPRRPMLEDFRSKLIGQAQRQFAGRKNLEAIRVRYRKADQHDKRSKFMLGIPVAPVKIGIELEAVTKAGNSGIVDVLTWWFNRFSDTNRKGGSTAGRDFDVVPPVCLFHQ